MDLGLFGSGIRSWWFTERFYRNALITYFEDCQAFFAARRFKNYAVPLSRTQ